SGVVLANAWAFCPVFPLLTRGLMALSGAGFDLAALLVNFFAGGAAALGLGAIAVRLGGPSLVPRAVALWCFFPSAFATVVPYSEAVYVMAAAACLVALLDERTVLALGLLVIAALSRSFSLPLAAAAWWHVVTAWRAGRRSPWLIALAIVA